MATRARASHILLQDEPTCQRVRRELLAGEILFADAAKAYSMCPSGGAGGGLGSFPRGLMIREFDDVAFDQNRALHVPHGCIATPFGYHVVQIHARG